MSKTIKSIKGFHDILPERSSLWKTIEQTASEVFELYGFSLVRTPVLEFTDVFKRAAGDASDLVEKEMYSFTDRDGSEVTLRPEGTAGVVRAFVENSLHRNTQTSRLYYCGEMFRHERPQKGRMRGFHQIGAEFFGQPSASADCEVMAMLWNVFRSLGIEGNLQMEVNSIGTSEERESFKHALKQFLTPFEDALCEDCVRRARTNPLRVLDCKNGSCEKATRDAPVMTEFLSPESAAHFDDVKRHLDTLSVPFTVNEKIVRGLDYYTRTVFEVKAVQGLGAQSAVAAGGRYDLLVESMGGPPTPATGFAIGVERVAILLEGGTSAAGRTPAVFVGWVDGSCFDDALLLCSELRARGVSAVIEHSDASIKSQIKRADKAGAGMIAIIGPDEKKRGVVKLRNMETGDERDLPRAGAADAIAVKKQ